MPAPFNLTNMSDPQAVIAYANLVTSPSGYHYFGDLMVVAIWVVTMGVFSQSEYGRGSGLKTVIVASFAAFFFSVILDLVGLVDRTFVILPFGVMTLSIVFDKVMEK